MLYNHFLALKNPRFFNNFFGSEIQYLGYLDALRRMLLIISKIDTLSAKYFLFTQAIGPTDSSQCHLSKHISLVKKQIIDPFEVLEVL